MYGYFATAIPSTEVSAVNQTNPGINIRSNLLSDEIPPIQGKKEDVMYDIVQSSYPSFDTTQEQQAARDSEAGYIPSFVAQQQRITITDIQSDVIVATYENTTSNTNTTNILQPVLDSEVSQESIDAGYMAFLAESLEIIHHPWLDVPDEMERKPSWKPPPNK